MPTNPTLAPILNQAIANVVDLLNEFADDSLLTEKVPLVFGTEVSSQVFKALIADLPEIEVVSDDVLQGALGSFSAQTGKIYLYEGLVMGNTNKLEVVLIEEMLHYLDGQFKAVDTPGDEEKYFSSLVRGVNLTEDDFANITLEVNDISGEQAKPGVLNSITDGHDDEEPHVHGFPSVNPQQIQQLGQQEMVNTAALTSLNNTFFLHSNPTASKTIYLDFNGHIIPSNSAWAASYNSGNAINAPALSLDADKTTFNNTELTLIQNIWQRVAEDFAPFDVNVTTQLIDESYITRSSISDQIYGMRALISPISSYFGNYGGIAYVDVFDNVGDIVIPNKFETQM